jgi:DNA-binding SARP family transcriptional activator
VASESVLDFRILGPLEVVEDGRPLALGGGRQRALLALLLTRANEVVSTERLVDELWGADPPKEAANALQYHVSQLRKALGPSEVILTRPPGYLIGVDQEHFDLLRFERLALEARDAPVETGSELLREALALWRGPALADLAGEPFAQAEIARLDELRLGALERRIDADLALGLSGELVGELEALVHEHPYREPFRGQLMLALYGAGRQAEALEVYRETRRLLVDELGLEPGPALRELEQAILRRDPTLVAHEASGRGKPRQRAIVVVAGEADPLEGLLAIAEPLAKQPARELILVRLLTDDRALASASSELADVRAELADRDVSSRVAAFTTSDAGNDATLLAAEYEPDVLLLPAPEDLLESPALTPDLSVAFETAPCDVAVLHRKIDAARSGPVVTPFSGVDNDWSAIELAAWLARSFGTSLRLLGTEADPSRGRRDASRLLSRASLLVQQVVGVVTDPVLVPSGATGVVDATRDARLLVLGLSDRWRSEGIGSARVEVATATPASVLFVRRGVRPGGLAPDGTLTRFTWTLAAERGDV